MDDTDRQLLIQLQREIPFQKRPFEAIGKKVGIDSADVILRINRLREEGAVERISTVFDMTQIHYQNVFIAFKVADENAEKAALIISRHPGVPLCSKRKGDFNLWFVLALPPQESAEEHCQFLARLTGAEKQLKLRTLKVYKPAGPRTEGGRPLMEDEIKLVRVLQEDLPLADEPYEKWSQLAGLNEQALFQKVQFFQKMGFLKKVTAFMNLGDKQTDSALAMWRVPEEKIDAVGRDIASFSAVRTCLQRAATEDLPYGLHAVIGSASQAGCDAALKNIEEKIGPWPLQCFYKEKDFKNSRFKYFSPEFEEWRTQVEERGVPPIPINERGFS